MKTNSASIQRKLMQMILFICGTVLLVACISFFVYDYITYRNLTRQELVTLGKITAANSSGSVLFTDKKDAQEVLDALTAQPHIVAAVLFTNEDSLLASYPGTLARQHQPGKPRQLGYSFTAEHLEGFEPVFQNGNRVGTLYLKSDMKAVYSRFRLYGAITAIFFGVAFLFTYLLSKRMQRRISQPIEELASKARLISDEKDYSVRAQKKSDDELGTLTDAFNHMLTQIEKQNGEIRALNATLEEKIVQRTRELQEVNYTLREQNEFIQTIINASVDLIVVFDADLKILMVNQYAATVYKKRREDLLGHHLLDVFPNLRHLPIMENLRRAFSGEFQHVETYESQLTDAYFENFYIPLHNQDDKVDRVLLIGHDITSIIRANQKLQQLNTELEKSNRDLEQFAYVASHDLQEPLRKIMTFSDLSEQHSHNPELQKRYLQKINSSASRMTQLIKAVLNYSRLSNTGAAFSTVDLNNVIEQIKTDLELSIEEKGARVEADQLPVVQGIPLQLNQLFLNLFTNSLKFSENAPFITIKAGTPTADEQKALRLPPEKPFVKITFADNGIGFDQKYAERVFSIFQRLHSADRFAGTGIGLALCKKIVENHGGMIFVESEPGKGTCFTIFLPATLIDNDKAQPNTVATGSALTPSTGLASAGD